MRTSDEKNENFFEKNCSKEKEFEQSRELLTALGDPNRQHLVTVLMHENRLDGIRVGELSMLSNMSRAAVSRHLRILREAGLVRVRTEGKRNYYSLIWTEQSLGPLTAMVPRQTEEMLHREPARNRRRTKERL